MTIPGSVARNFIGRLHLEQMRIGGSSSRSELIRQPSLERRTILPRRARFISGELPASIGIRAGLTPGALLHAPVRRLLPESSDDIAPLRDEAISSFREKRRKDTRPIISVHDQQRSSVMWDQFFSLIYRLSCRTTLIEIGAHRLAR
ncbi:hypothetical protein [Bradyrhizobium sp. 191]|uniref:hypothetical protein n=1 Tax=Bradyrhizobium sp. 191 TaxID=2782659 RepID=UPI002000054A|nr:hypothetical protein [Bradyrhizobium sp. 191]UPJ62878.1 hypothetical protein IVB23_22825 [Bradyrhizobium sp. 191]